MCVYAAVICDEHLRVEVRQQEMYMRLVIDSRV